MSKSSGRRAAPRPKPSRKWKTRWASPLLARCASFCCCAAAADSKACPLHPLARNRGSILGDTLHWRAHGMPGRYIAIQRDAADQAPLCLDAQGGSEPPVIRWASGQAQPVASGFIDFYAASHEAVFRQAGI